MSISNISALAASLNLVREGEAMKEKGIAGIAAGMVESWHTPMCAVLNAGKSKEEKIFFSFADMATPRLKDDGTVNGLVSPAMYLAVAENFGLGDLSTKDKQAIKRAHRIAGAREHLGIDVTFTPTGAAFPIAEVFPLVTTETERRDVHDDLGVLVRDEAGEPVTELVEVKSFTDMGNAMLEKVKSLAEAYDGTVLDDAEAQAKLLARKVVVNGKPDALLGIVPPPLSDFASTFAERLTAKGVDNFKPRTPSTALDKGAVFDASVKAVRDALKLLLSSQDESDFAPTLERNTALVELENMIGEYMSSDLARDVVADAIAEANAIREKREAEEEAERIAAAAAAEDDDQPQAPASGARPKKDKLAK